MLRVGSRTMALLAACATPVAVWVGSAGSAEVHAERVPVGRYAEIRYGVSRAHPCPAEAMDARRTGRSPIRVKSDAPSLWWKLELDSGEPTAPAVAEDGTLYLGTTGGVYAGAPDGRLLWVKRVGTIERQPAFTPSGSLLVVTDSGVLLELSLRGEAREIGGGLASPGFPLVLDGGEVAVAARDGDVRVLDLQGRRLGALASRHRGAVAIARLSSGLLVSASADPFMHVFSASGAQHRMVMLHDGIVAGPLLGDDDTIWVVRADGTLLGLSAGGRVRAQARLGAISMKSVPAVGKDGALRLGTGDDSLVCIGRDGSLRWQLGVDGRLGPVTLDADDLALAVSSRGVLYGVEPNGTRRFRVRVNAQGAPRPVPGDSGVIYIVSDNGTLSAWK